MDWEAVVFDFLWNKLEGTEEKSLLSYFDKILFVLFFFNSN